MTWNIQYTKTAENDLNDIYDHIAYELLEPGIAEKQINRIMDTADSLDFMPLRHRLCDYEPWRSMGWHCVPVDNYIIFYFPNESDNIVSIMRIMYGGRDLEKHLSEENLNTEKN